MENENQYPYNTEPEEARIIEDRDTTSRGRFMVILFLLLLLVAAGIGYYVYNSSSGSLQPSGTANDTNDMNQFSAEVERGWELMDSGSTAEAVHHFQRLVEIAFTPAQEGQAKLNLGVARLATNREGAVTLLKEVSINESYAPFTRAKAVNYVLNEYTATKDDTFAREHIFTGPVWADFMVSGETLDSAALNGFQYSVDLSPTPEATMRLAAELAFQIAFGELSQEKKDEHAEQALVLIDQGDTIIESLRSTGRVKYGDTAPTEIAAAYNRKGMALDVLYFYEYINDPSRVEDAFMDALEVILSQDGHELGTELYIRYHYTDFLVRLDAEGRSDGIRKILAPMEKMERVHNAATFFRTRIQQSEMNDLKEEHDLARPDNIVRLANISPEFREALLNIGVDPQQLEPA